MNTLNCFGPGPRAERKAIMKNKKYGNYKEPLDNAIKVMLETGRVHDEAVAKVVEVVEQFIIKESG